MKYSEERRHDPELRDKVAEIHADRQATLIWAARQLELVVAGMRHLNEYPDDAIYNRCFNAVWDAKHRVGKDAEFMKKIGGETYIGNLAAGELGQSIERAGL